VGYARVKGAFTWATVTGRAHLAKQTMLCAHQREGRHAAPLERDLILALRWDANDLNAPSVYYGSRDDRTRCVAHAARRALNNRAAARFPAARQTRSTQRRCAFTRLLRFVAVWFPYLAVRLPLYLPTTPTPPLPRAALHLCVFARWFGTGRYRSWFGGFFCRSVVPHTCWFGRWARGTSAWALPALALPYRNDD